MKVPLSDQIAAATRHRDQLERQVQTEPELMPDLHAAEATILTLALLQTTETEFRQFMAEWRAHEGRRVARGHEPRHSPPKKDRAGQ